MIYVLTAVHGGFRYWPDARGRLVSCQVLGPVIFAVDSGLFTDARSVDGLCTYELETPKRGIKRKGRLAVQSAIMSDALPGPEVAFARPGTGNASAEQSALDGLEPLYLAHCMERSSTLSTSTTKDLFHRELSNTNLK